MSYFTSGVFLTAPGLQLPGDVLTVVSEFVETLKKCSEAKGYSPTFHRLARHGNAVVAVDPARIFFGLDPQSGPVGWYAHDFGGAASDTLFIAASQQQLGFSPNAAYVWFSRAITAVDQSTREATLVDLADRLIDEELAHLNAESHITVKPIFGEVPRMIDARLCFVIMPFADGLRPVYEDTYRKVAAAEGLSPLRSDEIFASGPVFQDIWNRIATKPSSATHACAICASVPYFCHQKMLNCDIALTSYSAATIWAGSRMPASSISALREYSSIRSSIS